MVGSVRAALLVILTVLTDILWYVHDSMCPHRSLAAIARSTYRLSLRLAEKPLTKIDTPPEPPEAAQQAVESQEMHKKRSRWSRPDHPLTRFKTAKELEDHLGDGAVGALAGGEDL